MRCGYLTHLHLKERRRLGGRELNLPRVDGDVMMEGKKVKRNVKCCFSKITKGNFFIMQNVSFVVLIDLMVHFQLS